MKRNPFADPFVRHGMRFNVAAQATPEPEPEPPPPEPTPEPPKTEGPQVVSLDAFRRRPPTSS